MNNEVGMLNLRPKIVLNLNKKKKIIDNNKSLRKKKWKIYLNIHVQIQNICTQIFMEYDELI